MNNLQISEIIFKVPNVQIRLIIKEKVLYNCSNHYHSGRNAKVKSHDYFKNETCYKIFRRITHYRCALKIIPSLSEKGLSAFVLSPFRFHENTTERTCFKMSNAFAVTTVLLLLVLVDVTGNSLVCAIIWKNRNLRYILSLHEVEAHQSNFFFSTNYITNLNSFSRIRPNFPFVRNLVIPFCVRFDYIFCCDLLLRSIVCSQVCISSSC